MIQLSNRIIKILIAFYRNHNTSNYIKSSSKKIYYNDYTYDKQTISSTQSSDINIIASKYATTHTNNSQHCGQKQDTKIRKIKFCV